MRGWLQNLAWHNQRRREERLGSARADLERKYPVALGLYAVLGTLVWFTIGTGSVVVMGRLVEVRWVVLFIIAMFVFRTVMAIQADRIRRK